MAVNLLNINVRETLAFFDEKPCWSERQATAIVGVLGEDLSAAVLQHCLEANGASSVYVRNETVGTGGRSGPRLDRWIEADLPGGKRVLFQTEIKSWSAHAIGGEVLRLSAPAEEVENYKRRHWGKYWDAELQTIPRPEIAKVLVPMSPPFDTGDRQTLPLLIFWEALGPGGQPDDRGRVEGDHLFSIPAPEDGWKITMPSTGSKRQDFRELWVFSVSSYLRSIAASRIELHMPNAARRLQTLTRLLQPAVSNLT